MGIFRIILFALFFHTSLAHGDAGRGHLDRTFYSESHHALIVSGWVAPENPNIFATNIMVDIDGTQIYHGRMLRSERPDVVESTGRKDWLVSGFQIEIPLPDHIKGGMHNIQVGARFSNGKEIRLSAASSANPIQLPERNSPSTFFQLSIFLSIIIPLASLLGSNQIQLCTAQWRSIQSDIFGKYLFSLALVFSFTILVASGSSGSSLALLFENNRIAMHDAKPWLGKGQGIRSDEWEVITPMAISQKNHQPKFPIINSNWGHDGHNMLVVGMTGVPVAHVSAIAKPATWGFFVFDLRHALAWYWWFPFFSCLIALWLVLQKFFQLDWKISAALATSFAFAPYSATFSGWPAYTTFFPLASLLFIQKIVQNQRLLFALAYGLLLGVSISGFALVLYPAWQISLIYIFIPFGLAWCWQERKNLHFRSTQWVGSLVALCASLCILGFWWIDAKEAVHAIQNTVYPGQRVLEVGGDIDPWFFIKGLLSLQTMYRPTTLMDPSDAGSFIFLPLALVVSGALTFISHKNTRLLGTVLAAYMLAAIAYMFIGSNAAIARWSLWGAVTSYRLDLALGLVQIFLMAWIFSSTKDTGPVKPWLRWTAWSAGIATFSWGWWLYQRLPFTIASDLLEPVFWLSLITWGALAYFFIIRHYTYVTVLFLLWMLAISLPFNPLGQAPNNIVLDNTLTQTIKRIIFNGKNGQIAIIGERTWPLVLAIADLHVTNSVFYHPPITFWKKMDPTGDSTPVYNRYQRLFFRLQPLPTPPHQAIQSPRLDEVVLTMDPEFFNFAELGAEAILSPSTHKDSLLKNQSLEYITETNQWIIFKVKNQN